MIPTESVARLSIRRNDDMLEPGAGQQLSVDRLVVHCKRSSLLPT